MVFGLAHHVSTWYNSFKSLSLFIHCFPLSHTGTVLKEHCKILKYSASLIFRGSIVHFIKQNPKQCFKVQQNVWMRKDGLMYETTVNVLYNNNHLYTCLLSSFNLEQRGGSLQNTHLCCFEMLKEFIIPFVCRWQKKTFPQETSVNSETG